MLHFFDVFFLVMDLLCDPLQDPKASTTSSAILHIKDVPYLFTPDCLFIIFNTNLQKIHCLSNNKITNFKPNYYELVFSFRALFYFITQSFS